MVTFIWCAPNLFYLFKAIYMEFKAFAFGVLSEDCPGNALLIYESATEGAGKRLCGDRAGWQWITIGSEALLKLTSDSSNTHRVFEMNIKPIEKVSSVGKMHYSVRHVG